MNVFLDANILISVLNKEYPQFIFSARVLSLVDKRNFSFYTTPVCLAIAFYFAEKKHGTLTTKKKLELLASKINITDTDKNVVLKAIQNKSVEDFEDGLEYYSALQAKCKCIITDDVGDFYFSEIEVMNAEDFLKKFLS